MAALATPSINSLLRRPTVEQLSGDKRTTIYNKIKLGLFPKPVTIGRNRNGGASQVAWPAKEVEAINKARIAGKSDEEIKALVVKLHAARAEAA